MIRRGSTVRCSLGGGLAGDFREFVSNILEQKVVANGEREDCKEGAARDVVNSTAPRRADAVVFV